MTDGLVGERLAAKEAAVAAVSSSAVSRRRRGSRRCRWSGRPLGCAVRVLGGIQGPSDGQRRDDALRDPDHGPEPFNGHRAIRSRLTPTTMDTVAR